jgi:hypothetical protein
VNIFSGWDFPAMLAVCLLLVTPRLFRFLDTPPTGTNHKLETLDGLRGFLALGVVAHHATEMGSSTATGVWQTSGIYLMLGQGGGSHILHDHGLPVLVKAAG